MRAAELRDKAKVWLRAKYPQAFITHELSVAEYGGALVDVAAILPDQIIGVEIKGEGDSPSRLGLQGFMYSRVCRSMFLLSAPSIRERCSKVKPQGWGELQVATGRETDSYETCAISGLTQYEYYSVDETGYGLSPVALAAMPWTKEYSEFSLALGYGLPRTKLKCIEAVIATSPLRKIEKAVCEVLRKRNWEAKQIDRAEQEFSVSAT